MGMLVNKVRLAIGGKKSVATSIVLILVTLAGMYGFEIDAKTQADVTVILGSLIAIFLRLGMKAEAAKKGDKDE